MWWTMSSLGRAAMLLMLLAAAGPTGSCSSGGGDPDAPVTASDDPLTPQAIREGVVGRILGDGAQPLAGASVVPVSLDDPSPPIPEIAITSESDGRYSWPLRPGRYEIRVTVKGYESAAARVTVDPGQVATLDFTLTAEEGSSGSNGSRLTAAVGRLVGRDDHDVLVSRRGQSGECAVLREEPAPGTENQRVDQEHILIHQLRPHQRLNQPSTSEYHEILVVLFLQPGHGPPAVLWRRRGRSCSRVDRASPGAAEEEPPCARSFGTSWPKSGRSRRPREAPSPPAASRKKTPAGVGLLAAVPIPFLPLGRHRFRRRSLQDPRRSSYRSSGLLLFESQIRADFGTSMPFKSAKEESIPSA